MVGKFYQRNKHRWGFSLIEILIVIGIMGMIAGLLMPAAGLIQERAQRFVTGQKLRQIGLGLSHLSMDNEGKPMLSARTLINWVEAFGRVTGIVEGEYYYFPEDPMLAELGVLIPDIIVDPKSGKMPPEIRKYPLGLTVVSPIKISLRGSAFPVLWTRGLQRDGYWKNGVYGDEGGFILYSNGRVKFYRNLVENGGSLYDFTSGKPTVDYANAIPQGSRILEWSK